MSGSSSCRPSSFDPIATQFVPAESNRQRLAGMKRLLSILTVIWAVVGLAASPSLAQNTRGSSGARSVEGIVTDASGSPVANATVLLKDTKSLQVRSFITQQDGAYRFHGLSGDVDYEIRAQYQNSSSATKNISSFDSHRKITIKLKLK
jgi:hypothetical protein